MGKVKEILGKIWSFVSRESLFRFLCFFLIGMSIVLAIDTGIKGEYKAMHNHINWVLWVGISVLYSYRVELEEARSKAYLEYIEASEKYQSATEGYINSIKETSEAKDQLIKHYEDKIKKLEGKDI